MFFLLLLSFRERKGVEEAKKAKIVACDTRYMIFFLLLFLSFILCFIVSCFMENDFKSFNIQTHSHTCRLITSNLQTLNYVHQYVPKGTNYFDKTIRIDKNPIKTALNVCKHLISKRVYAVVVSHDEKDSSGHDLSPAAVSYTRFVENKFPFGVSI